MPDTRFRCQAFASVSRRRNLEGPVSGPGTGRIGSSPALRASARVGSTRGIEPCSPNGVPEGHRCGVGADCVFAAAGYPNPCHGAHGGASPGIHPTARHPEPRRTVRFTRLPTQGSIPTHGASLQKGGVPRPGTVAQDPVPLGFMGGAVDSLRTLVIAVGALDAPRRFIIPAAQPLNPGSGTAGSTRSGRPATADRTLTDVTQFPPG